MFYIRHVLLGLIALVISSVAVAAHDPPSVASFAVAAHDPPSVASFVAVENTNHTSIPVFETAPIASGTLAIIVPADANGSGFVYFLEEERSWQQTAMLYHHMPVVAESADTDFDKAPLSATDVPGQKNPVFRQRSVTLAI